MKLTKYVAIIALFGAGLFISCTPENIEDDNTEQQVKGGIRPPAAG